MIKFDCIHYTNNSTETWKAHISRLVYFGSHCEMRIHGKSDITAIFGNTSSGYFIYFPEYETGCNIPSTTETFEIASKLLSIFSDTDAVTVAYAITMISELFCGRRKQCKKIRKSTNLIPF